MGRRSFEPTAAQRKAVKRWAKSADREQIAKTLGIHVDTLRKYFTEELEAGFDYGNMELLGKAFSEAMAGNTAVLIFLLKTRLGMREKEPERDPNEAPPTRVVLIRDEDPPKHD